MVANHYESKDQITNAISLITTAFPVGAFIGSILYSSIIKIIDSENLMMKICDFGLILLMIVNMFTLQFEYLLLIRFFTGFLTGLSATLVPMYIMSLSPTELSGRIGSLNQIFITIGIAWAYAMGFLLIGYT